MKNIFLIKEVPFLLTLLVALIAYQMNNIVSEIIDSPAIEYNFKVESNESKKSNEIIKRKLVCDITNISKNKSFKNISLVFRFQNNVDTKFEKSSFIVISPSSTNGITSSKNENLVNYKIINFQPEQRYKLELYTCGNIRNPKFPLVYLDETTDTVRLIERNLYSIVTKNYLGINIYFCLFWVIGTIVYIYKFSKYFKDE